MILAGIHALNEHTTLHHVMTPPLEKAFIQ